jgi:hypothetical protein
MYTFPNFKFIFTDESQKLKINRGSLLHHAGYINDTVGTVDGYIYGAWTEYTHFEGSGAIELIGGGYVADQYDTTLAPLGLIAPAKLNIEGGASLRLPETIYFLAENSQINLFYNQNIVPVYGDPNALNSYETGRAYFHGRATLNWSEVFSAIPEGNVRSVFFVKSCIDFYDCLDTVGLTAINCRFENTDTGEARLRLDHQALTIGIPKDCYIRNGMFKSFEVNAVNPYRSLTVDHANFDRVQTYGIRLSRSTLDAQTYNIRLTDNYFYSFLDDNTAGIYITDLNKDEIYEDLWIADNIFEYGSDSLAVGFDSLANHERIFAAIYLGNSSGTIMRNRIEDPDDSYENGIYLGGPITQGSQLNSFVCNNYIYACDTGLFTQGWKGIAKLNEISYSLFGHVSGNWDDGLIAFSNYHDNAGPGLTMKHGNNRLDLRGMHDTSNNYAFYDTYDAPRI